MTKFLRQSNFIFMASTLLLIIAFFTGFVDASRKYKYESSYAFLDVQNGNGQFCVNFQQWRSRDLPALAADSTPKTLKWWIAPNGTDICKERKGAGIFAENVIIPAEYVTKMIDLKECIGRVGFNESEPMRMKAVGNEVFIWVNKKRNNIFKKVAVMKAQGVRNILFLVEKGKPHGYGMRDYLFTHFYNSEIDDSDESMNIFYIYEHVFKQQIQPNIVNDQHFRFYQPQSSLPMDPAVAVLWLFAFSSILIGSIWAAAETRAKIAIRLEEEGSQTELTQEEGEAAAAETNNNPPRTTNKNAMKRSESTEIAQMSGCQHCISVGIALVVVVSVLMLAFFFRDYAVHVFNVFLVILGIFAIQSCLLALLRLVIGESDFQIGTLRQLFCGKCRKTAQEGDQLEGQPPPSTGSSHHKPSRLDRPIFLFPFLLYIVSASICIFWYAIRNHAYAFLLLDPINLAICIYSIRASRIRSLRLITFLLLAMFVYDIFMVFGTRLLTQDGCSVMIQVVTGMDCRSTSTAESMGKQFQPIAPIDAVMPEKLPLLFYMPMLADPMGICYDLEVEREFKHVMLGLGDVILPGYLIAFCFYMDVVEKSRFHTYGLISMIGYSLGMACTFIALLIMETAQPALIYLVPFTLIPVYAWAIFGDEKGTLGKMWRGEM